VTAIHVSEKAGEGSALGVIAGGVAGALLGNQVGSGHGRELATVAGAAGGAYAGNKVEQKAKASKQWTVHVQYEDGKQASFNFDHDPQLMTGDRVKHVNGSIVRN
jgi:outer membrane lipoprotein SlyB